jgi:hypothetical protein
VEAAGLAGVADLAGDASFCGAGDCFPQPESRTAIRRQKCAARLLLSSMFVVMGTIRLLSRIAARVEPEKVAI